MFVSIFWGKPFRSYPIFDPPPNGLVRLGFVARAKGLGASSASFVGGFLAGSVLCAEDGFRRLDAEKPGAKKRDPCLRKARN